MTNYKTPVLVTWEDHYGGDDEWFKINEVKPEPCICQSGWIIYQDKHRVILCANLHPEDFTGFGSFTIVRSCIRSIKRLPKK